MHLIIFSFKMTVHVRSAVLSVQHAWYVLFPVKWSVEVR
jgi:hypothetical protein